MPPEPRPVDDDIGGNLHPRDRLPLFVHDDAGEIECGPEDQGGFRRRARRDLDAPSASPPDIKVPTNRR